MKQKEMQIEKVLVFVESNGYPLAVGGNQVRSIPDEYGLFQRNV